MFYYVPDFQGKVSDQFTILMVFHLKCTVYCKILLNRNIKLMVNGTLDFFLTGMPFVILNFAIKI